MAWGRQKKAQVPPSTIRQLLPLIITLLVLGALAWVGYQIYLSLAKIQAQARRQMGDNVVFTKDGVRVHVKNTTDESYVDRTQSWVVKAWNLGAASSAQEEAAKRKRNVLTKPRPGENNHYHD